MKLFKELPQSETLAGEVAGIFSERVAQQATPGVRFAVFDASGVAYGSSFGSTDAGTGSSNSHTHFRIASCTKSFTAAAVLLLRDRGCLSLDDPVTRYAPALSPTLPVDQPEPPTVRMLLSMAGGLPTDDPWADRQESLSKLQFDALLENGVRFVSAPGTRYEYSNLGYALLGRVIEVVSAQSYTTFVNDNLIGPLGLHATGFDPLEVSADRMATGFRKIDAAWEPLPFTQPGAFSAIGGIVTTTDDLTRWALWLGDAFRLHGEKDGPLSAGSRREMQQIQCAIIPEAKDDCKLRGYGYGLAVEYHEQFGRIVSHSGGYPGFSSHMRWSVETGLGVIAFENATYSGAWVPAIAAFNRLMDTASRHEATVASPPASIDELVMGLQRLIQQGWDETIADSIFLENVKLDKTYSERAAQLSEVREKAGELDFREIKVLPLDRGGADDGFGRFEIHIPCAQGKIVVKAECGPPQPCKLQSATIEFL